MARIGLLVVIASAAALRPGPIARRPEQQLARRAFFASAGAAVATMLPSDARADAGAKLVGLAPAEIAKLVKADVVERQFLCTADFTRGLYDEAATFTDEIDTYKLDSFVKGTKALFVADKSHVDLTSDVEVTKDAATFLFSEYLTFNLPVFKPRVSLTGKVVLKRSPETGLFVSYREFWDQSVVDVLKTAKL